MPARSIRLSTAIGAIAILLWSTLAILTTGAGQVPPFQLTAMTFALAFLLALAKWLLKGESIAGHLRQPPQVWLVGVGGLFGYHFFYFVALRNAPPVEANLINYLWPLLIVLFSALLPGERLRWYHAAGVLAGLAGTALLVTGGRLELKVEFLPGYFAALACALTWSAYSVINRRFGHVPTDAVGGFCGLTALLALLCHLAFEATVWPQGLAWLSVVALGLGPVGAAFFLWDHGVKHGDIRALGAAAYATPLLSTLLLIVFGQAEPGLALGLALVLIVGGAVLGAGGLIVRRAA
ncbi:MAG: EamA family transporter [Alphaproteobacteria bacterium]|nr:EamA family transporter [Alphaproteobacteria bacterium]